MAKLNVVQKTKAYWIAGILMFLSSCAFTQVLQKDDMNCPEAPKCVSSLASDSRHYIKPFTFKDSPDVAMARLKAALLNEKRVSIITSEPTILRAEVRSFIFRFVDDVEFTLIAEEGVIHIRSSARIGYSDFGVNRRRIERIRALFQQ